MSLAVWLREHIKSHMLKSGENNNRRTFKLKEHTSGVRMTLRVDNVPREATVMRFDKGKRRDFFEPGTGSNFLTRCDFLILVNSGKHYRAVFIELKRSFDDEETERQHEERGEEQLRWSLPSLKYLISVFEVDKRAEDPERRVDASYFLIAKYPNQWFRKRKTREHFKSRFHEGIVVHYSTKTRFKYEDLISREVGSTASQ